MDTAQRFAVMSSRPEINLEAVTEFQVMVWLFAMQRQGFAEQGVVVELFG